MCVCVCDIIMIDVQYFLFTVNIQLCNDSVVSHMIMLLKFLFSHLVPQFNFSQSLPYFRHKIIILH